MLVCGVHPLVEKPFALTGHETRDVGRLAAATGIAAGAVSQHRLAPAVVALRAAMLDGRLGEIHRATVRVRRRRNLNDARGSWRRDRAAAGGGVLITVGIHYLDVLTWCLGARPPEHVADGFRATAEVRGDVEDALTGAFRLAGVACSVDVRWGDLPEEEDLLSLVTDAGRVVLQGDRCEALGKSERPANDVLRTRQLRDFLGAVCERRPTACSPESVAPALDLIDQLYRAAGLRA
jgi:predicted dehydrogenase